MQLNTQISAVLRGAVSRGIKAAEVDARGNLVFTLTDNSRLDMGMVHGTDITKVEQTVTGSGDGGENTITVTLSDGTEHSFTIRNGSKGDRGDGFILLGIYATEAELLAAHPTGSRGDAYAIGTATSCVVYIWDIDAGDWRNVGQLKGAKGDTGATGAAGADGVSATHSWDGTVLTVTSASGTSSADLKGAPGAPGKKGETGATGPKGDALFASGLTSADTIEESASIPFIDSASANRKTTWANIKNLLNQYFSTLFSAKNHASAHGKDGSDAISPGSIGAASLDIYSKVKPDQASATAMIKTASFSLSPDMAGRFIRGQNASGLTVTVPANASVAFPLGTEIEFMQELSGALSFAGASGVTIHSLDGALTSAGQYSCAALKKLDENVWVLSGAIV